MEKFNNDIEDDNLNHGDTTCPMCLRNRFWLKFYCNKAILYCQDCGYFVEIWFIKIVKPKRGIQYD